MYKYIINDIPPSNNKFIGRNAKWEYQQAKKMWCDMIGYRCSPKPPEPLKGVTVSIRYFFKNKIRRDPDNYAGKFILDGLVRNGILVDDSFDCIDLRLSASVDRNNPRTEIDIR